MASWCSYIRVSVVRFNLCAWYLLCMKVTERAKLLLDAGEEIPCDLMAKILKFQLLQVKASDRQRREAEQVRAGSQIFKGVASLIYDCLDWRRQHQHYLDSIKLINIPWYSLNISQLMTVCDSKKSVREQNAGLHPLSTHADMRYYKKLLDTIPPEASSVHLILHCMLEQVGLCLFPHYLLIWTLFSEMCLYSGFDPAEVELSMMRLTPVGDLIRSVQQRNGASCWMAVKQQLQHYCTDDAVSWPEVERLLHQSVFETMPLTGVDRHGVLLNTVRPPTAVPWDNPLSYAEQQLHNLRTKGLKTLSSAKKSRAETDVSSAKTPVESTTTAAPPVEEATERHQTEEPFKVRAPTNHQSAEFMFTSSTSVCVYMCVMCRVSQATAWMES
uniref:Uncharacterized protein n=1 Tax=Monopterus albus TaxID=43700 RepID=A0A3Q3K0D7_MONAL